MGVTVASAEKVAADAVASLGLDAAAVSLISAEGLAAVLRRAASFLCPTSPLRLVQAVDESLVSLPGYSDDTRSDLRATLDALVSYGDLVELPVDDEGTTRRRLFLGPPTFVSRPSGSLLLTGVRPEGAPLIDDAKLEASVEYNAHVRTIPAVGAASVDALTGNGLVEIDLAQWTRAPRPTSPDALLAEMGARLAASKPTGDVAGLQLLDPEASVAFYRGRWRGPKRGDRGSYVGRRPQAFGADRWCYVEVVDGEAFRLLDFPITAGGGRGADDALRLQAAIDAATGRPQRFRVHQSAFGDTSVVDLFSPLPTWAQRRLDVFGVPLLRGRGALMSYAIANDEVDEESRFLQESLWMTNTLEEGSPA